MYLIITDHKLFNKQNWHDFVRNHPHGNIFHTPEMVELYDFSPKCKSLVVGCIDESNKLVGLLTAVIHNEYEGLLGKLTERAIVYGGPLVNDNSPEIAEIIIGKLDQLCGKRVVYSQYRNLWNISVYKDAFSKFGYAYEEHLDILFDLKQGKDALWKGMHPTRRKQINRGINRNTEAKIISLLRPEELTACYSILKSVYNEAKLPFPPISYFRNALTSFTMTGYFRAVLAHYKDEIIGFRFFLCYKGLIYDWYAGSRTEHYDKYPNDILPWEILKWGTENGYDTFDFGGAGKPNIPYGVRDYKMKFGGTLVNFGRFQKVHKPILMEFAKIAFKVWKNIKH